MDHGRTDFLNDFLDGLKLIAVTVLAILISFAVAHAFSLPVLGAP
jgi:hypothetical protein